MTAEIVDQTTIDSAGGWVERGPSNERRSDRYDVTVHAGDTGIGAGISLDGVPMKGVISYFVEVGLRAATKVTVTFYANSVNETGGEST